MESKNHQIIKSFITKDEANIILQWVACLKSTEINSNRHLQDIGKALNGDAFMFDISKNEVTNYITNFQAISNPSKEDLPEIIKVIIKRICSALNISNQNSFLQVLDMQEGGEIKPHYDASISGQINYKCNISVLSKDYKIFIDSDVADIEQFDLYSFEASLYKHWTEKFDSRRVLLSFGFILPYSELGRTENDPRIRMSERIQKYFQS